MIEIAEKAATQIQKMLTKRALGESGLRVGVKAGGCSGFEDRKSTRLNSSHIQKSRMPSSA